MSKQSDNTPKPPKSSRPRVQQRHTANDANNGPRTPKTTANLANAKKRQPSPEQIALAKKRAAQKSKQQAGTKNEAPATKKATPLRRAQLTPEQKAELAEKKKQQAQEKRAQKQKMASAESLFSELAAASVTETKETSDTPKTFKKKSNVSQRPANLNSASTKQFISDEEKRKLFANKEAARKRGISEVQTKETASAPGVFVAGDFEALSQMFEFEQVDPSDDISFDDVNVFDYSQDEETDDSTEFTVEDLMKGLDGDEEDPLPFSDAAEDGAEGDVSDDVKLANGDVLSSDKPKSKMKSLRRSRIVYEGDVKAVSRRFMPSNIRAAIVYIICLAVIIGCGYGLFQYLNENNQAEEEFNDVGDSYTMPEMIPVEEQSPDTTMSWPPLIDFAALQAQYPDVAGWIRIPNTSVDYPVLTNPEENYYLHRSMNGGYSMPGAIFCDHQNTNDLSQQHIVIYGHHMIYASMFHDVAKYNNASFFEEHRTIYFETPEYTYVLRPIAMYYCEPDEIAVRNVLFENTEMFQRYLDERLARPDVIKYEDYTRETLDRLVTLITCSSTGQQRQIVECVPEQVYPTSMVPAVIARGEADTLAAWEAEKASK